LSSGEIAIIVLLSIVAVLLVVVAVIHTQKADSSKRVNKV